LESASEPEESGRAPAAANWRRPFGAAFTCQVERAGIARSVLEGRFGPLQEKHFRAANALEIVERLNKPVLIVQGTADESVPFEHGKLLYQKLQAVAQHRPVPGGNHHLTNVDRGPVIADIVHWLGRQ
jgi:fermentation-respiration switch protein FrsA (DUF1100 family)